MCDYTASGLSRLFHEVFGFMLLLCHSHVHLRVGGRIHYHSEGDNRKVKNWMEE
jgi:hypothetical protein